MSSLYIIDGPHQGRIIKYPHNPPVLVLAEKPTPGELWPRYHDYARASDGLSIAYRHSSRCACHTRSSDQQLGQAR